MNGVDGIYVAKAAAFISAALAMGIGTLAPAYGQGLVGSKACENIGKYPESAKDIRGAMVLTVGIIESSAVYALLVAGALVFVGYSL
ncbi:MAG: ATP synthase subunit c, sodium ion specific [Candidatus Dependentiae bacterium ADurb.Bin331]|nr:MAG: ATP synthase subunit c, sodium ion specific [Candidatus Dependentiae bacterium ADurb.Bin331]